MLGCGEVKRAAMQGRSNTDSKKDRQETEKLEGWNMKFMKWESGFFSAWMSWTRWGPTRRIKISGVVIILKMTTWISCSGQTNYWKRSVCSLNVFRSKHLYSFFNVWAALTRFLGLHLFFNMLLHILATVETLYTSLVLSPEIRNERR